jgi:hypothetical protein
MKLTKGKLTKLYSKKKQTMKKFKMKDQAIHKKAIGKTFRKKRALDLNHKTLKSIPTLFLKKKKNKRGGQPETEEAQVPETEEAQSQVKAPETEEVKAPETVEVKTPETEEVQAPETEVTGSQETGSQETALLEPQRTDSLEAQEPPQNEVGMNTTDSAAAQPEDIKLESQDGIDTDVTIETPLTNNDTEHLVGSEPSTESTLEEQSVVSSETPENTGEVKIEEPNTIDGDTTTDVKVTESSVPKTLETTDENVSVDTSPSDTSIEAQPVDETINVEAAPIQDLQGDDITNITKLFDDFLNKKINDAVQKALGTTSQALQNPSETVLDNVKLLANSS